MGARLDLDRWPRFFDPFTLRAFSSAMLVDSYQWAEGASL